MSFLRRLSGADDGQNDPPPSLHRSLTEAGEQVGVRTLEDFEREQEG